MEIVDNAPKPANSQPIPPAKDMQAELRNAAALAQKLLGQKTPDPFLAHQIRLQLLDKELERCHETFRVALERGASVAEHLEAIEKVRNTFIEAIQNYSKAAP